MVNYEIVKFCKHIRLMYVADEWQRSVRCADITFIGVLALKLLLHSRFCIGDYMDISITPPNRVMPMMRRRPY